MASPSYIPVNSVDSQKEFLVSLLCESRERLLASFAGVSEEESRLRPEPDRWCVLDTVEHITAAETLMGKIVTTQRSPRTPDAPNREELFFLKTSDRSRRWEAPETSVPRGRFATLAEAAAVFKSSRNLTIQFVENNKDDLRTTEVRHPHPGIGVVSTCEMLIIMAKHAERHALQIEEIRKTLAGS
jgi:uncharacterized damage-inducible protein DinB